MGPVFFRQQIATSGLSGNGIDDESNRYGNRKRTKGNSLATALAKQICLRLHKKAIGIKKFFS